MLALLDVELRRALSRRLVRFTALFAVLGITVAALIVFFRTGDEVSSTVFPPPPEAIEDCMRFEFQGVPDDIAREQCEQQMTFTDVRDRRFHLSELKDTFGGMIVPLVIVAWLIGASLIGAEWRAGTMTTMLTWEPRRVRVMAMKAVAVVGVGIAFFLVVQAFLGLALLPSALFHGTTDNFDLLDNVRFLLRGALLAGVGAMIGFSLGSIGKNATLAMAAGFIYLAVLEGGLLGGFFPGIRRWLIVGNAIVLMTGIDPEVSGRGQVGAAVLLLIYGVGAVALATIVARTRDVTA